MRQPDRLGDAIRELARVMAEHGRRSMRFGLVSENARATYEIRLVSERPRAAKRFTIHDSRFTEFEAFGPASDDARQMADHSKE